MSVIEGGDLFSGAGGFFEGMSRAAIKRGIRVNGFAINHWPRAIENHSLNHPSIRHACEDVQVVRPRECVPSHHLHLLLAAPSCIYHSNARGNLPVNEQDRASAWCIVRWLTEIDVDTVIIENVPEFRNWGPCDPVTKRPIKAKKGQYFKSFMETLRSIGYNAEDRILCCADFDDPTSRRRMFIIATKHGEVEWPKPSRCRPTLLSANPGLIPWRTARNDVIDWKIVSKSIFLRKKRLAAKTLERTYAGFLKHGGPNAGPFLHVLRHYIDGGTFERPFRMTSKGDIVLCDSVLLPHRKFDKMDTCSVDEPLRTIEAINGRHFQVAEPVVLANSIITTLRNHNQGSSLDEPVATICGSGNHIAKVDPVIINMKGKSDGSPIDGATPTQTAKNHLYVAEPQSFILPHEKFGENGADSIEEPLRTLDAHNGDQVMVCTPLIVRFNGERPGQEARVHSIDDPLPVQDTSPRYGLAEPIIVEVDHGNQSFADNARRVQSVDDTLRTLTGKNGKSLATPIMVQFNGNGGSYGVDESVPTLSTKQRYALAEFETVDGFVPGLPIIILPNGTWLQIDVHLRMLQRHELAAAHSVRDYKLVGTSEETVKMIGNMVPAGVAEALCGSQMDALIRKGLLEKGTKESCQEDA